MNSLDPLVTACIPMPTARIFLGHRSDLSTQASGASRGLDPCPTPAWETWGKIVDLYDLYVSTVQAGVDGMRGEAVEDRPTLRPP